MRIVLTSIRCPWAKDSCRHNTRRRTKASSSNPNNGHVALVTNTTALHHCISCSCDLIHWISFPFTTDNTLPVVAMTVYLDGCYARDASSFRRQWQQQLPTMKTITMGTTREQSTAHIARDLFLKEKSLRLATSSTPRSWLVSKCTRLGEHKDIRVKIMSVTPVSYLSDFLLFFVSNSAFSSYQYCRNNNLAMVFFDSFINLRPRCLHSSSSIVQQCQTLFFRE